MIQVLGMASLALVAAGGLALAIAALARALRVPHAKGAWVDVSLRFARWMIAALLAASGIWVAASPRAEQPLLDALERAFPAITAAYMDERERAAAMEAGARGDAAAVRDVRSRARQENRWAIGGA